MNPVRFGHFDVDGDAGTETENVSDDAIRIGGKPKRLKNKA